MTKGPMTKGIVGGIMMPHAPQFFTLPDTEDKATVERVRTAAEEAARHLKSLRPDVWVIVANDHANQFLLHATPPFTVHLGGVARGGFAGRSFDYPIASDIAYEMMRLLYRDGFDPAYTNTAEIDYAFGIPLTFLGVDIPVLPIYINSYVPPQPTPERCYAFGQAVSRALKELGIAAVVTASGGMSHFPGTDQYAHPKVDFDRSLVDRMATGNLRAMLAYDDRGLDETGNVELRSWLIAAGMLGERKPDLVSFEPSWHHTYVTLAFWSERAEPAEPLHYPGITVRRIALTQALHTLAHNAEARAAFIADPEAYSRSIEVTDEERRALVALDVAAMVEMGVHPLVPFLAEMQIRRDRDSGR